VTLLDHGADLAAIGPELGVTPRRWAKFFRHQGVADLLRQRRDGGAGGL
jgi:hypothetical protein